MEEEDANLRFYFQYLVDDGIVSVVVCVIAVVGMLLIHALCWLSLCVVVLFSFLLLLQLKLPHQLLFWISTLFLIIWRFSCTHFHTHTYIHTSIHAYIRVHIYNIRYVYLLLLLFCALLSQACFGANKESNEEIVR